jgi:hypothetical protein
MIEIQMFKTENAEAVTEWQHPSSLPVFNPGFS